MLRRVEVELRTRGKVSLPSLHRHVILDGWLKPTVGQAGTSNPVTETDSVVDKILLLYCV